MSVVSARSLTRRYGARTGIEGIRFDVPEGALFGFLGPNGSGKTTTLRVLMGFLRPHAGTAAIFGLDCWRDTARIKRDAAYLPGDLRLPAWLSGEEGLRLFGAIRRRDIRRSGRELAERLGLDLSVTVRRMSRGMRQKLGLILTLAPRPRLLVLDEPTSALDPLVQEDLRLQLLEAARAGQTVVFSSHSLSEVDRLCDRVVILRDGRIVEDAALADLRARCRRLVEIEWADGAANSAGPDGVPETPPEFLRLIERRDRRWICELDGSASALAGWIAGRPIADLVVGPPDLASLFRSYYGAGAVPGRTSP